MRWRNIACFLVICGLAAPSGAALVPTALERVADDGTLYFADGAPARLQGVLLQGRAIAWLQAQHARPVYVRRNGHDRYGRARVVVLPSRKRSAPSWQETLLRQGDAIAYDRAALPKKWLNAERSPAAITPVQASERIGSFAFVEGRIAKQHRSRKHWYVNFGEDWQRDFSLQIPRKFWRSMGKDFTLRDGERVRARGALFFDHGPAMEITRPEQIALLDRPAPAKAKKKAAKKKTAKKKSATKKPRKPRTPRAKPKRQPKP